MNGHYITLYYNTRQVKMVLSNSTEIFMIINEVQHCRHVGNTHIPSTDNVKQFNQPRGINHILVNLSINIDGYRS